MSDSLDSAPIHPVAPRLKNGPLKPHVGPTISEYKAAHAQTVGPNSDEWWAKARQFSPDFQIIITQP